MSGGITAKEFIMRFESLKKSYFSPNQKQFDAEGEEIISAKPDRGMIAKMFEGMNVEIPMHPNEPPVIVGHRTNEMIGEWWNKKQIKNG